MKSLVCVVDGRQLWCSSGGLRISPAGFEELCSVLMQERQTCEADVFSVLLPGLWSHEQLLWTPHKDIRRPLEEWQNALGCPVALFPLSMLGQSTCDGESHVWLWLGDSLEGALVTPQRCMALNVGHWPLLEDRQCRCGGRSHADAFGSVDALRRACDAAVPGKSLQWLWEHREESLLAPIWGKVLKSLASVVVTALSLDASLQRCLLCGPLAELDDFADELGDVVYPLLPHGTRHRVELLQGPSVEMLLKSWTADQQKENC